MTENLTEKDKFLNTYSNYGGLRIISFLACLFSLFYFPKEENSFFFSYYNYLMNRDIFWAKDGFWKQMNTFVIMSYGVAMAVLIINAVLVKKERREGAFADIAIYGYLTLLNPMYVLISMIGSKSSRFYEDSKITILVIPFIYFLAMLIFHIKLYIKNREGFYDRKDTPVSNTFFTIVAVILVLALIILPGKNVITAVTMSMDYSGNYGLYKAKPGEIGGIDEDIIGNKNNRSFIWDGKLHIVWNDVIYVVDDNGELVERYNVGVGIDRFILYSNGTEDILYIGEEEKNDELKECRFNIYSLNLRTETINQVYSESSDKNPQWILMFSIKDDYLYYMLYTGDKHDETIYRFRIPENAEGSFTDKEFFVSDVGIDTAVDYAFLYNYDIQKNRILFGRDYYQPYKGALYYSDRESVYGWEYDYRLLRKDYNCGKNDDGYDKVDEIAPNAEHINIYKDKIYFTINDTYEESDKENGEENKHTFSQASVCCVNLDGSDYQVLAEYKPETGSVFIDQVCVSDDYIVYRLFTDKSEWIVIKR